MMLQEENKINPKNKCCFNCKWFEARTCFCRLNPPQVVLQYVNRMYYPSSVFPKISVPAIDWCKGFENKNEREII